MEVAHSGARPRPAWPRTMWSPCIRILRHCSFTGRTMLSCCRWVLTSSSVDPIKSIIYFIIFNLLPLQKGLPEPMNGYLSLHQISQSLVIKWTPNELMNGAGNGAGNEVSCPTEATSDYWLYALNINVDEIVYVHCHQNCGEETGGTIILVGQDGVQQPPIHFPEGGHMQAFLNCLETGLLPNGQLDPPLWSQRSIGQIFSWSKSMRKRLLPTFKKHANASTTDYVFRVVNRSQHEEYGESSTSLYYPLGDYFLFN